MVLATHLELPSPKLIECQSVPSGAIMTFGQGAGANVSILSEMTKLKDVFKLCAIM